MLTTAGKLDLPGLVQRLSGVFSRVESAHLALRCLRVHENVAGKGTVAATLDCSRRAPSVEMGHTGTAHLVVHVDERALVPRLVAYSLW